jgi:hypothetical protein
VLIEGKQYLNRNALPAEYDEDTIIHQGLPNGVIQVSQVEIDALVGGWVLSKYPSFANRSGLNLLLRPPRSPFDPIAFYPVAALAIKAPVSDRWVKRNRLTIKA